MKDEKLYIGCPVHIVWDGEVKTNFVGYVRRINWTAKIAEVGPETCIGSHLRVYEFDRLVPTKFSSRMHPKLLDEIVRLRSEQRSETDA